MHVSSFVQRRGAAQFEGGGTSELIAQRKVRMRLSSRAIINLREA
jgi:hypothetical protein